MNEINFLNSISEKKYISFSRWTKISCLSISTSLIFIAIAQIRQISKINLLKKERTNIEQRLISFDSFVNQKSQVKKYKVELEKQLKIIKKISSIANRTFAFNLISNLMDILSDHIYLQNFEFDQQKGVYLQGFSTELNKINEFIKELKQLKLVKQVKLEYLKCKESEQIEDEVDIDRSPVLHEFFIKLETRDDKNKKVTSQ